MGEPARDSVGLDRQSGSLLLPESLDLRDITMITLPFLGEGCKVQIQMMAGLVASYSDEPAT